MKMMTEREKDVVERDGITKEENTMWYEFRLIFLFYLFLKCFNKLFILLTWLFVHLTLNNK